MPTSRGSSGERTAALSGAQPTLRLTGPTTDQEPEESQSPSPCKARALCEQDDPGGSRAFPSFPATLPLLLR